jgi:hypothetical protein
MLLKKIDDHQQPQVVFNKRNSTSYIHATLVSHYKKDTQGNTTLRLRDNNYSPKMNKECKNTIKMNKEGELIQSTWIKPRRVNVNIKYNEVLIKSGYYSDCIYAENNPELAACMKEGFSTTKVIGKADIGHNETPDTLEQFEALKEHCDKEKGCQ